MKLPEISHLQFAVLAALLEEPQPGRVVRGQLASLGVRQTGPAFYQMMARLEDAGRVKGWYDQKVVDGQIIKERVYQLCPKGKMAWESTREFYQATSGPGKYRERLAHA